MRFIFLIFICLCAFSCVKRQSKDPVPFIEYKNFIPKHTAQNDSAYMSISYSDGDGDIFRDKNTDGPNLIGIIYIYDPISKTFQRPYSPITQDSTGVIGIAITQPGDGYKGKSVSGDIIWPMSEYRPNTLSDTVFFYKIFMQDMKGNKSNVVTTPIFKVK